MFFLPCIPYFQNFFFLEFSPSFVAKGLVLTERCIFLKRSGPSLTSRPYRFKLDLMENFWIFKHLKWFWDHHFTKLWKPTLLENLTTMKGDQMESFSWIEVIQRGFLLCINYYHIIMGSYTNEIPFLF